MTLKPWRDVARETMMPSSPDPAPAAGHEALTPAALQEIAAAANPDLQRLLEERDRLERRIGVIVAGSPGSFTAGQAARFPIEPLGERRARDARWAQTRDEDRSTAIRRILDARRREAAADLSRWDEARDRQRVEAVEQTQTHRLEREAQAAALDARIERARTDLLAERWAARTPAAQQDWYLLREEQAAVALAEARARTAEATAREQALERRVARDRARRPDDWSEDRDRARAKAIELARRQAIEAAAAEQELDQRLIRARADRLRENRAAHDPDRTLPWTPPSGRRDLAPLPAEASRPLPLTAAERSLDERITRARAAGSAASRDKLAERRREGGSRPVDDRQAVTLRPSGRGAVDDPNLRHAPAGPSLRERPVTLPEPARRAGDPAAELYRPRPERRQEPGHSSERSRGSAETFDQRRDRLHEAAREDARRRVTRARHADDHAAARATRDVRTAGKAEPSPGRPDRKRGEVRDDAPAVAAPRPAGSKRVRSATDSRRDLLRAWEERRDRIAIASRKPDDLGFRAAAERRLGVSIGSIDELTALRDRARELWPETRKKEQEQRRPKTTAERLDDLDGRRQRAMDKLTSRRRGEARDERRRELSLDRLASTGDRFGDLGR